MEEIRPRVRVAGVLIENGKILLIQHHKEDKKYWLVPGGGVDWGEQGRDKFGYRSGKFSIFVRNNST